MKEYFVYILASKKKGTLYSGVTNDLLRRVQEHKLKQVKGFTKKYNVTMLVYFETTGDVYAALNREKQLKRWKRNWRIRVIEEMNPDWKDLFFELGGYLPSQV